MSANDSSKTTILAVDDRPDNLLVLEKVITDRLPGCTVLTAGSAADGLSIADDTPLDGMLIDVQMPYMDGIEMCRHLKANSATAHIPIILMTAHGASPTQKAIGLDSGADDFINKPIDNTELIARVSAILRIKKAEDQLRRSVARLANLADHRTRQLADSEHYYRSLIYNLHEDIIVIDSNYVITDINNSYIATVGRGAEDIIGHHCYEISHDFDKPCDQYGQECPLRKVFDTGLTCRCQHTHTGGDGAKIHVDILASPMKDKDGNITHVVEAIRDVTPLMEAQEQQRASEERYRSVVEDSPVLICRSAPGGIIEFVNDAYCRYFAKTRQELIGSDFLSLIPADSREAVTTNISALTADSPISSHEHQVIAPGGEIRWQRWTNRALFDEGGQLVAYQALGEDITDRKQAEEELAERTRINQMLLDSLPCVAMLLRPHTREIVASNEAASKVGAVPGKICWGTWAQREAPCPWCLAPEVWDTGENRRLEVEYMGIIWDAYWYPVSDDLYLHYAFDITKQKDLEAQLRQAQKMEAVGRLAGGIAHDFRNQLTVITGYSEWVLSRMDDDSENARDIREIVSAARRSTELTGHLLAFSRREILEPRIVNPMTLIDSLVKPLRHMIGEDVVLATSGADDLDNINIDPGQFEHMLMNLAVNARDAMPDGGDLRIDVTSAQLDSKSAHRNLDAQPGKYVAIAVSDTGVGMDAETRQNAFDPFFTTKGVGEGTGLGLSMVYGFVRQSGGYITIDSEVGHGTTFTIYLPATTKPTEETKPPAEDAPAKVDLVTGTILTVEDNEQLRNMLVGILRKGGHTVIPAGNAREALPLGEHYEGQIDLLITDVVMPGMNGVELAGRLRAARPDMPVLFISGYGDSELIRRGLGDGNAELLLKPFGTEELLDAINRMLA